MNGIKELLESHKKIIKVLQSGQYSVAEIAEETQYTQSTIRARISELLDWGIPVQKVRYDGLTRYFIPLKPMEKQIMEIKHSGSSHFRIALLSDTHLGAETGGCHTRNHTAFRSTSRILLVELNQILFQWDTYTNQLISN